MNNSPNSLLHDWVASYCIEECQQRISQLPERGFSRLRTTTEFGDGDTYNQPFILRRVSRNIPVKWLALSSLHGNFAYLSPESTQVSYQMRVNWWFYSAFIPFLLIFLLFADEFGWVIMGFAISFSLAQTAINVWLSQRYMKKQLREALT